MSATTPSPSDLPPAQGLLLPEAKPTKGDHPTPMMEQYLRIKGEYADCLLFYRMGDFYELFFDDAVHASVALDITLTKRGKHSGADIPMCGVPIVSAETYLERLIKKGFRVAVCEQTENPAEAKKRGAKSVVKREVVRIITAGTLTEDTLLNARTSNHLLSIARTGEEVSFGWSDVSVGALFAQTFTMTDGALMEAALARLEPSEILITQGLLEKPRMAAVLTDYQERIKIEEAARFDSTNGAKRLRNLFKVGDLSAFGAFSRAEIAALGALVDYVALTQKGTMPRFTPPRHINADGFMEMDSGTRRNLELVHSQRGEKKGTLLEILDATMTGAGARLLRERLNAPLCTRDLVEKRHQQVGFFVPRPPLIETLRGDLKNVPDMERALQRISVRRGGPRDLMALKQGLQAADAIRTRLLGAIAMDDTATREIMDDMAMEMGIFHPLTEELGRAMHDGDMPPDARVGGFIRTGYNPKLDELKTLRDESNRLLISLESRYRTGSNISTLKIRHNNVLGYFVEVPTRHGDALSRHPDQLFIHRQTLASATRFTTRELGELEGQLASAAGRALSLEVEIYHTLCDKVAQYASQLSALAACLACLDVTTTLAHIAYVNEYQCPEMTDAPILDIKGGRHPVVEQAIRHTVRTGNTKGNTAETMDGDTADNASTDEGAIAFIANDCTLADLASAEERQVPEENHSGRLWLLTGPNMAGKSTYLRQNALIVIMAQMGSWIPVQHARIGIVDKVFSRVGAADDLARGRSTFMVEMVETAGILHQATDRSLVILDEIGRGTATYDGLSIAWAVLEYLHNHNRSRALFATHYHELTTLAAELPHLSCHHMKVREWEGKVIFLHQIASGSTDKSYGIHVGRLAGLPDAVVRRAWQILDFLTRQQPATTRLQESPLPPAPAPTLDPAASDPLTGQAEDDPRIQHALMLADAVEKMDVDGMNPRDAHTMLYALKDMLP